MTKEFTQKIRPLADRVVVEPLEVKDTTPGGIVLPDVAQEKPSKGVVLAVGPGGMIDGILQPIAVKKGDLVLYGKYSGNDIEVNGKDVKILREGEILAVIEG